MKEFNLDAALNGEPVNASGQKCYVVREVTEFLDDQSLRRFIVIFPNITTSAEVWDEHDLIDDIGMWEEPRLALMICLSRLSRKMVSHSIILLAVMPIVIMSILKAVHHIDLFLKMVNVSELKKMLKNGFIL